jgi:hypothetical protein
MRDETTCYHPASRSISTSGTVAHTLPRPDAKGFLNEELGLVAMMQNLPTAVESLGEEVKRGNRL